jgi:hypothetical protein
MQSTDRRIVPPTGTGATLMPASPEKTREKMHRKTRQREIPAPRSSADRASRQDQEQFAARTVYATDATGSMRDKR